MSDTDVLNAAFSVIAREGFTSFTLRQVSEVVGISPAALIKRFKSKEQLALRARNLKWDENLGQIRSEQFDRLSGLKGVFDFLGIIARSVNSKRLGEHAMWLGREACYPRSRGKVAAYFETTRNIFSRLIVQAVELGELKDIEDAKEFAKTMEALVQGAIFQFAFLNERDVEIHLLDHFKTMLKPYLTQPKAHQKH